MGGLSDAEELLGRTIERVVVHDDIASKSPRVQIFLQFEDGLYTEFYSDGYFGISGPCAGDPLRYTQGFRGGKIVVYGPGSNEQQERG